MAIADSNYGRVAYIAETTFGTAPANPTLKTVRMTSSNFSYAKETAQSNELRVDRMVGGLSEVGGSSSGSIAFELSLGGTFDELLEAALCGNWTTAVDKTGAFSFASADNSITDDTASNAFADVSVGQWLFITDAVDDANSGWHQVITKVSANEVTVGTVLADEAADTVTIKGRMLRNGTVKRSFAVEQAFTDINQYFLFLGQRLNTMSLSVQAGSIVTGEFGFQGASTKRQNTTFSTGGTPTGSTSSLPVNATSNVGAVVEAGSELTTAIQSIALQLDNGLRTQNAIGSKFPKGIGYGRQTVSGTLDAYFEDGSLYDKFLNHTSSSLSFSFSDGENQFRITLPRVYFASAAPSLGGIDQDVMQSLEYTAIFDPATACQIQVDVA